jgi:tetratricopeptide (TPR) repeat protein
MIAKAHDNLYFNRIDHTPERRALGDAAVNEAVRLRPDLPEVHLALAFHLYACYRDFERARVQVAIAAQALPNNPYLLQLTADIDQAQGHWEKATAGLERAATLDPRNPEVLNSLVEHYMYLRRYRDYQRILDRLIELQPDEPAHRLSKAICAFFEKADLRGARAACEAVPPSIKDDVEMTSWRVYLAMCARDFAAAKEILNKTSNEEVRFIGAPVPRRIWVLWLELMKGNHPTIEQFGSAREQLYQNVQADPTDPFLLTSLAVADVALGRKEEAMQEGRRAMGMRPVSEDAVDGPIIAMKVALVYVWANQPDLAFEQLNMLIQAPRRGNCLHYGDLKTDPEWDPIRTDPRFDKLLAELAPRD